MKTKSVSEHKHIEEELQKSRNYLEKLYDSIGDPIFSVKLPERVIDHVNSSIEAVFGYKPEECIGKSTEMFYPERKDYLTFGRKIKEALEQKKDVLHTELLLKRKSGEVFPSEITTAFFKENGKVSHVISTVRDITERKRAENELLKRDERYRALFSSGNDAIFVHHLTKDKMPGKFIEVNEVACERMGYTREELLNLTAADISILIVKDGPSEVMEKLLKEKHIIFEAEQITKDGRKIPVEVSSRLFDLGGQSTVLSIARDITERKRREEALNKSESRLTDAQKLAHLGNYEFEVPEGEVIWSEETFRILGRDPSLGEPTIEEYMEIVHPDDRSRVLNDIERAINKKQPFDLEYRVVLGDGQIKHVHSIGRPVLDESGTVVKMFGTILDITERKRSEDALRESEEKYRDLYDNAPDMYHSLDKNGIVIDCNKTEAGMLGYKKEEIIGRPFTDFLTEESRILFEKDFSKLNKEKTLQNLEREFVRKDGTTFTASLNVFFKWGEDGKLIKTRTIARDITERKRAEDALRNIAQGVSAKTGGAFFSSLALHLTKALDIDYVLVGELIGSKSDRVETIAICAQGEIVDNFVYNLGGTPCKNVLGGDICSYPSNVQKQFPDDHMLEEMGVESYMGAPLFDSAGGARGLLAVMSTREFSNVPLMKSMLRIFAVRASAELERRHAENELKKLYGELEERVEERTSELSDANAKLKEEISQRKLAENELHTAVDDWKVTFDSISEGLSIHDSDMNIVRANRALEELLGVSTKELIGKKCFFVFHGCKGPIENCPMGRSTISKVPERIEIFEPHLNSWLSLSVYPKFDEKGEVSGVVHVTRDITERKNAEKILRESEERYRALFNSGNDAVFVHSPTKDGMPGKFIEVNDVACERMGYTREELLNLSPGDISIIESGIIREIMKKLNSDKHVTFELIHVTKKGKNIPVEINSRQFDLGGRPTVLSIARDVTERMKSDEEIRSSLKEKEVLLQEVHHRVKNNLQFISSLLSLQSKQIKNKEDYKVFKSSQGQIKAMALLHEELYRAENLENINFEEYTRKLLASLLYSYGARPDAIALRIAVSNTIGLNKAIPCGLIINELVSNSLKYAFSGKKRGVLQIKFLRSKGRAKLIVSDNGVGIPKGIDFKNTETFGLRLVNMLVEQIDGTIELDRHDGTKFTIIFDEK